VAAQVCRNAVENAGNLFFAFLHGFARNIAHIVNNDIYKLFTGGFHQIFSLK